MKTLPQLVEQIDYELNHNPAPVGDGGMDDAGLARLLAEALPHLERFASLTLCHHPESDSYWWTRGFKEDDGLTYDVSGDGQHEARAFEDPEEVEATLCSVCGSPQTDSPSGRTCENGHGGADAMDDLI